MAQPKQELESKQNQVIFRLQEPYLSALREQAAAMKQQAGPFAREIVIRFLQKEDLLEVRQEMERFRGDLRKTLAAILLNVVPHASQEKVKAWLESLA